MSCSNVVYLLDLIVGGKLSPKSPPVIFRSNFQLASFILKYSFDLMCFWFTVTEWNFDFWWFVLIFCFCLIFGTFCFDNIATYHSFYKSLFVFIFQVSALHILMRKSWVVKFMSNIFSLAHELWPCPFLFLEFVCHLNCWYYKYNFARKMSRICVCNDSKP